MMQAWGRSAAAAAVGLSLLAGCSSGTASDVSVSVGSDSASRDASIAADEELVRELKERGRTLEIADMRPDGVISDQEAIERAVDYDPRGDRNNVSVRYGTYSRADMARSLPSPAAEANAGLLESFEAYVVTLHGVETPYLGPHAAEAVGPAQGLRKVAV